MRRSDLPGGAIRLDATAPALPRLCVQVAGPRRFWVSQDARPVLLAEVSRDRGGVHYRRLPGYASVVPPITAPLARTPPSWPHRHASWLQAGPGPLHAGSWSLRPWPQAGTGQGLGGDTAWVTIAWRHELAADPAGYLDWSDGWQGIVPMRTLPGPRDGRVKAYRKLAREGALPPVLLWWVSGLDGRLLLDGHARLAAALAEDLTPATLELSLAPSPAQIDEEVEDVTRHGAVVEAQLERAVRAGRPGADRAIRAQHRRLAGIYASIPGGRERTRAWPLPGGESAWENAATASAERPDAGY